MAEEDGESGEFETARSERAAMYPMTGYALVRIDYEEPPGEALTKVAHYGRLEAVEVPSAGPMTEYVVYDADGNAYDRDAISEASAKR
ncbi:hypothetical protein G9C85_08120 [Halorubellus sp. JP-L1]|uniref:hypothetical protein n=1 Tax=Halorubellus sp. JP-L1 TaxID=2715753 RepID=UPI00140A43DA|nr:hypothetical protein [Halorubellus sp. JP-L1]NHN41602.1 hypothetical protein [Halorubellus sp. JP-L1]